jgi:hypothetical protein
MSWPSPTPLLTCTLTRLQLVQDGPAELPAPLVLLAESSDAVEGFLSRPLLALFQELKVRVGGLWGSSFGDLGKERGCEGRRCPLPPLPSRWWPPLAFQDILHAVHISDQWYTVKVEPPWWRGCPLLPAVWLMQPSPARADAGAAYFFCRGGTHHADAAPSGSGPCVWSPSLACPLQSCFPTKLGALLPRAGS